MNQNISIPNGGKISGDEFYGKIPLKKTHPKKQIQSLWGDETSLQKLKTMWPVMCLGRLNLLGGSSPAIFTMRYELPFFHLKVDIIFLPFWWLFILGPVFPNIFEEIPVESLINQSIGSDHKHRKSYQN